MCSRGFLLPSTLTFKFCTGSMTEGEMSWTSSGIRKEPIAMSTKTYIPEHYAPLLNLYDTQKAIGLLK